MNIDRILAMKTDPLLLESLQRAAATPLSQNDLMEQRVSFVFGSIDCNNGVTREQVRDVIMGLTGTVPAAQAGA